MDKGGIATSVLSISSPGVWLGDVQQGRKLARMVNDYGAKLAHDFPGRFGLFAALPLPDTQGTLREIEYAFDTLKADGIGLLTSYGNKWLGDKSFAPVWEQLDRRKAVIYTHPTNPACCASLPDEMPAVSIEWATDTTRTVASLLFSGTAARYPNIRWIFSHGGGTTPFLLSRLVYQERTMKGREAALPNGLMPELKKFYYDTAQANHPGALAALLKLAPPSQILFGTDYPFRTAAEEIEGLTAQHFTPRDLLAIERLNALRLMPELSR
jgi:predicted TIM-barrel fold metal-dependent hydrolase